MKSNKKEKTTNLILIKNQNLLAKIELLQTGTLDDYLVYYDLKEYNKLPEEQKFCILDKLVACDSRFTGLDSKIGRIMVELEILTQKAFDQSSFESAYYNLLFVANRSGFYAPSFKHAISDARLALLKEDEAHTACALKTSVEKVMQR